MIDRFLQFFKKRSVGINDFSSVAVDIHSHLIPGIDDGAPDMETAMELIKKLSGLGYQKIVTTPHIMSGVHNNTHEVILAGMEQVREEITKASLPVEFYAAAEYYLDEQFEQWIDDQVPLLTIGDKYVLFETGFGYEPANLRSIIFKLNSEGYKPIFAHPERYHYLHGTDLEKYEALKEMGLYFQLNISSLAGTYTRQVRIIARKLIDRGLIDFIGTDLHNKKHLESLRNSMKEIYLEKLINSGKLLNHRLL